MAKSKRDNFSARVVGKLGERVNYICSNPDCNAFTIGPHQEDDKATRLGVAAHICAAAPGGPRYDPAMSKEERESINNGLWLCVNCSTLIDKDQKRFPATLLHEWKRQAETKAQAQLGKPQPDPQYKKLQSDFKPRAWQAKSVARFHFSARATDLIGRESEFTALLEFCQGQPEQPFSWHLLLGKGGMGKSRLAYELGLHLAQQNPAWDWQFLGSDTTLRKNLALLASGEWRAQRPTLLIVDYAATVAEELRAAILACAAKPEGPCLRLLLIERNLQGDWYQQLLGTASGGALLTMQESRYQAQALELQGLSIEAGLAILQALLTRYQSKPACDLRELLDKLDAEHRPLFILFLADALREGGAEVKWQAEDLTQAVLDRELKRWEEQGVLEVDKHLICFATLCGEIDLTADLPEYLETLLQEAERHTTPNLAARMALATNAALDGDRIPKLEPDLLGELFVLQCLPMAHSVREKKRKMDESLFTAAWQVEEGYGLYSFISRTVDDFSQHIKLLMLLDRLDTYCFEGGWEEIVLAGIYSIFCMKFTEKGKLSLAKQCNVKLQDLCETRAAEERIALLWANAMVGLMAAQVDCPRQGQILLDQIVILCSRFPASERLYLMQANAVVNLVAAYSRIRNFDAAEELLDRIVKILFNFHWFEELAYAYAQAVLNLSNAYIEIGDIEKGLSLIEEVAVLCGKFPLNHDIALIYVQGQVNLMAIYAQQIDVLKLQELVIVVSKFCMRFPDNLCLAEVHAKAMANLIFVYIKIDEFSLSKKLLDKIVALCAHFPCSEELANVWAMAALEIDSEYADDKLDQGEALLERLMTLCIHFPYNQELTFKQAHAAFNLGRRYLEDSNIERGAWVLNLITTLCAAFPENQDMALVMVKMAFNLVVCFTKEENINQAQKLMGDMTSFCERFSENQEIALSLARAGFNLTFMYCKIGDVVHAQAIVDYLEKICIRFPDNEKLAVEYVGAAGKLLVMHCCLGNLAEGRIIQNRVTLLCDHFEASEELTELHLNILICIMAAYSDAEDAVQAKDLLKKVFLLCDYFPNFQSHEIVLSVAYVAYNIFRHEAQNNNIAECRVIINKIIILCRAYRESSEFIDFNDRYLSIASEYLSQFPHP